MARRVSLRWTRITFCHAAEKEGICRGGIPAAHHDYRFALVKHPVAGGAVGHAPAHQLRLSGNAQRSGVVLVASTTVFPRRFPHWFPRAWELPSDRCGGLLRICCVPLKRSACFCIFSAREKSRSRPQSRDSCRICSVRAICPPADSFSSTTGVQPRPAPRTGRRCSRPFAAHHAAYHKHDCCSYLNPPLFRHGFLNETVDLCLCSWCGDGIHGLSVSVQHQSWDDLDPLGPPPVVVSSISDLADNEALRIFSNLLIRGATSGNSRTRAPNKSTKTGFSSRINCQTVPDLCS